MSAVETPRDYAGQLSRLHVLNFASSLLPLLLAFAVQVDARSPLGTGGAADLFGVPAPAIAIGISIGVAVVAALAALHERLARVLRIRVNFDAKYILRPMAEAALLRPQLSEDELRRIRNCAMDRVFYHYTDTDIVSNHHKAMVHNRWSYYYATLNGTTFAALASISFVLLSWFKAALWCAALAGLGGILVWVLSRSLPYHTRREVDQILAAPERVAAIRKVLKGCITKR